MRRAPRWRVLAGHVGIRGKGRCRGSSYPLECRASIRIVSDQERMRPCRFLVRDTNFAELRSNRRTLMKGAAATGVAAAGLRGFSHAGAQDASPVAGTPGGTIKLALQAIGDRRSQPDRHPHPRRVLPAKLHLRRTHSQLALLGRGGAGARRNVGRFRGWLTYTFNLRQGVTWHDGEAFTAEQMCSSPTRRS